MRIHLTQTEINLQAIITSLTKDASSLSSWLCIHIEHTDEASRDWYEVKLQQLKERYKQEDCDVILCPDNDILIISREHDVEGLHQFESTLKEMGEAPWAWGDSTVYDLGQDWRRIRALLSAKLIGLQMMSRLPEAPSYNFGEIESLQNVFTEAKRLRKFRMPLHVLVVEDDVLTRRIVTGTFKEEYAIITAADAHEAIANYMFHAPDIVFLDIGLPDTSGFSVLRKIIEHDPEAYVVMFSANSYLDNITLSLSNGAAGFVPKPFKKEKMRQYIEGSALHHAKQPAH